MPKKEINFTNTLILVALEVELPCEQFPEFNIQYSGVGKINATYSALSNIRRYKPTAVVNFGSAGSVKTGISGLVGVDSVSQRDMDVQALGFDLGVTPFEEDFTTIVLDQCPSLKRERIVRVNCSTGDNFVSSPPALETDIVDMELYAIAKVCRLEEVPILSWKYISDNADHQSSKDWEKNVKKGFESFNAEVLSRTCFL